MDVEPCINCGDDGCARCGNTGREAAATPAPAKAKRKKSTSPTQRTLAECRKRGYVAQVVERYNPHARVRVDLFGVIDLVAITLPVEVEPGITEHAQILGIQACAGASHADRRDKILAEPRAKQWVDAGGRLELWSWSKRGDRHKRKLWTLRVEAFSTESEWGSADCTPHTEIRQAGGSQTDPGIVPT